MCLMTPMIVDAALKEEIMPDREHSQINEERECTCRLYIK